MPIYEYQCHACGDITEEMQKFSETPLTDCPSCGAVGKLHKLISQTSFVLKGTGWYETDFKDKSKGNDKSKAKPGNGKDKGEAKTETDSKSESKTESKTESKSESKTESKPNASTSREKSEASASSKKSQPVQSN